MNSSANRRPTKRLDGPRRSRSSASSAPKASGRARRLQDALERGEFAVFVCDVQPATEGDLPTLRILFANPASHAITGLDPSDAVAQDLVSLLIPKRKSALRDRLADLLRAGQPTTVGAIRRKVGRAAREFELAAIPLGETDERATPWVFVVRKVAAQQQQQDRGWTLRQNVSDELIASQAAELRTSHDALQRSERMAALGTLVAGLGHDLNNLLLPIRGHLKALESAALDDSVRMHVYAIGQAIDYLQQLNDNLRLFALDPEGPGDARGITDICEWWRRLRTVLERAIPEPVQLQVDLPDALPPVGVTAHRLTQAVLNLLINAGEAITGSGTIRLWARDSEDPKFVHLGVTDSGRGMTAEIGRRAFEPFFTTKRRGRATGLGLSLVHGIVHAAGGTVELDSAPHRGTTIILRLPVATTGASPEEAAQRDDRATAAVSVRDRRIAACFEALLASAGFTVQPAPTDGPGRVDVWVTEPSPKSLRLARKLRESDPRCRIVMFGRGTDEWLSLGVSTVAPEGGLATLREALSHAISARG
jgi:signal transduction histidine kinase